MLTIGRLVQAAGVKVPTIRNYERIGPLPLARLRAMVAGVVGAGPQILWTIRPGISPLARGRPGLAPGQ
jgi:hypothetical protein